MELHIKHKALIVGLIALSLLLGLLYISTLVKLNQISEEPEFTDTEITYLRSEEAVIVPGPLLLSSQNEDIKSISTGTSVVEIEGGIEGGIALPIKPALFEYIQVIDGCAHDFEGECLNVRSGPGVDFPAVSKLRNGVVLKVSGVVQRDGNTWYKIVFDEWIRYPERIQGDWYVSADYVRILMDEGIRTRADDGIEPTNKRIVVSRGEQKLWAYDGDELFMELTISTGVELTPTPRGTFTIFRKTPSRYMQGPLPGVSDKYWDLPGVPWNLYFTHGGAVIHGAYWHDNFGSPSSSGCVNVRTDEMEKLYNWAPIGTKVVVTD